MPMMFPAAQAVVPFISTIWNHYLILESEVICDIPGKAVDAEWRASLDEFLSSIELALTGAGVAMQAKTMVFLNPDETAMNRYIVHLLLDRAFEPSKVTQLLSNTAAEISMHAPEYRLKYAPCFTDQLVIFVIEAGV
ncbi:acetaldehyde dehydrogenase family protein [Paenibacillus sp. WQ 127069]|uniref:Acetaldehyde dehydrogenase family protein n=1 Tax=Paenibacillus baimaensis TaxID=2982185 RepID=A0ABT2UQ71_9BACL|nr:acetaldehyde dehydrogenase family protein [Paenibacillus sp. WQ 127069]MCU6796191.1 acetaldehyde dehydrogenase family protein [Paenibacillus sp. WQ 127069]